MSQTDGVKPTTSLQRPPHCGNVAAAAHAPATHTPPMPPAPSQHVGGTSGTGSHCPLWQTVQAPQICPSATH
ncbi:MAG TPA: hypothetical protein VFX03_10960, partial [Thermomicrobiales bacterium]|nr:hypothetical protein [Thermomicrobiales bacterium]